MSSGLWKLIMLHVDEATWPSQRSMSWTFSLLALMSLLCNSLPSRYIQGQQCSQGIGCPQASFANRAMSTPLMNRAASWTPRGSRLLICRRQTPTLLKCPNYKKTKSQNNPLIAYWPFRLMKYKAKHRESVSSPFTPGCQRKAVHNLIQSTQKASIHNLDVQTRQRSDRATNRQTTRTKAHSLCGWFT